MKAVTCVAAALALLLMGCRFPWEPEFGPLVGTVRYTANGPPAYMVKVAISGRTPTFTDLNGRFRLDVAAGDDTVVVGAWDACRGTCVETYWGFTKVAVRRGRVEADILLDKVNPI
jgi:hypothetical protein